MHTTNCSFYRILNCILLLFWFLPVRSQNNGNLVPNYSFETTISCSPNGMTNVFPWKQISNSTFQSINYTNACFQNSCCSVPYNIFNHGYQYPRTGNAYVGMWFMNQNNIHRGYLNTQLWDSLKNDNCYYVEFFVNLINVSQFSVNNIALLLSKTLPVQGNSDTPILANPQILNYGNPVFPVDTINWIKVSGIYRALGGEKYITIGNFKKDADTDTSNTNFSGAFYYGGYYIDDVSVIPLDSLNLKADAGPDTTISTGDSLFIGTLLGGTITTTWFNSAGQPIANNVPGITVSPAQNTWYVLEQNFCGKVSRDTVYVSVQALPLRLISFDVQKHNDGNLLNWTTAQEINVSHFIIEKSNNGSRYTAIGAQDAGQSSYYFADKNLSTPISYYRLKMIDRDGKFTYSPVKSIKNSERETSTVYPNPSLHGIVTIAFKERGKKNITVTDVYGKIILQKSAVNEQTIQLNITGVSGIYQVSILDTITGKREVEKVIVQ